MNQNLLTEWHARYAGRGVMIYWHVDRKSACIYSQLKRCSSSEVASMIKGVLRHCTHMDVQRKDTDSHGQSEVAFAFCRLLGFEPLPRLRAIATQRLYRSDDWTEYITPMIHSHINSYGSFRLDLNTRLPLDPPVSGRDRLGAQLMLGYDQLTG